MKIERLRCFAVTLPLTTGQYQMSHGRILSQIDSTVLELTATDGTTGYGETSTLGSNYIDGFAGSLRAAVKELAPVIFSSDVLQPKVLNFAMDAALLGHRPAKALIDNAFWDLRGKLLGQPVYNLLGGQLQRSFPVFCVVSLADPSVMAAEAADHARAGFRSWQLKLGSDPLTDAVRVSWVCEAIGESDDFVTCDGNRGWAMADATRFIRSLSAEDVYVEQPVESLLEMAQLRARFTRPFIADEAICTSADLANGVGLGSCDAVNIKPARVGGITRAAEIRDLAQNLNIKLMVDEPFGGEISVGSIAHLSASTRPESFLAASHLPATHMSRDDQPWVVGSAIPIEDGQAQAPDTPGLGVEVDPSRLGTPILELSSG
jgi:cis-L-3-hydroxyproline dehydratase